MPFKATLKIDENSYTVLELSSTLEQNYDKRGKPVSGVKGGLIQLLIEGTADDTFASWITHPETQKDGTITIDPDDPKSKFKKYEFKNAYMTRLNESFIVDPDVALQGRILPSFIEREQEVREKLFFFQTRTQMSYVMYCEISAEKITIDGVDHDNKW
jgi:type VI secretion system TssD-like protein